MSMRNNDISVEYVKELVERRSTRSLNTKSLLGSIIAMQVVEALTGREWGYNDIPYASAAWLADNMYELLEHFVDAVECDAEACMMKTSKLEGSHYAAMKKIMTDSVKKEAVDEDEKVAREV